MLLVTVTRCIVIITDAFDVTTRTWRTGKRIHALSGSKLRVSHATAVDSPEHKEGGHTGGSYRLPGQLERQSGLLWSRPTSTSHGYCGEERTRPCCIQENCEGGWRGKIEVLNNMGGAYNLGCLKKVKISREASQLY